MTSIEHSDPVLPAVIMGGAILVVFVFFEYFSERRRRREFRRSWESSRISNRAASSSNAPQTTLSFWSRFSASWRDNTAGAEAEHFPSFASYFIHHVGRYGYAVFFVTLALVIRWALEPALEGRLPYTFFLASVLFTARTKGIWETMLALVLGFMAGTWFFAEPSSMTVSKAHDWWAIVLYFVIGLGIVFFLKSEQTAWLRTLNSDLSTLKLPRELDSPGQSVRELMANIVESAQLPILSITRESRIITWNAAAEKLLGFAAKEAIGQPLSFIIPEVKQAEQRQILEQINRGERTRCWRTELLGKGGKQLEASLAVSPVNDQSGKLIGASVIVKESPPGA